MVSLGHNELKSRYFKSWFIIIKKIYIYNKKNGNYRNDDWVKIMWLVTRFEMNWWNTTSVFECCKFGFSLITIQLFISWQWKQNHGYWSLIFFMYWWLNVMNWWYCAYVFVKSFLVFFFWMGHLLFQEISLSWKDESIRFQWWNS